jgi:NAD-dependent SIR2 family protein deacetylase
VRSYQATSATFLTLKCRRGYLRPSWCVATRCMRAVACSCSTLGIPDFRSPEGLFQTLKRDNPKESLTSGKDLFDASVFRQETTTSLFCQMIGRLAEMSQTATPTPFHRLLKTLDQRGRLLRVYTQNIDGLEEKSGLSFGVPDFEDRRQRGRAKPLSQESNPPTRLPTPPADIPRCIPLHGTLQTVHCLNCNRSFPSLPHVSALRAGSLPTCRGCEALDVSP